MLNRRQSSLLHSFIAGTPAPGTCADEVCLFHVPRPWKLLYREELRLGTLHTRPSTSRADLRAAPGSAARTARSSLRSGLRPRLLTTQRPAAQNRQISDEAGMKYARSATQRVAQCCRIINPGSRRSEQSRFSLVALQPPKSPCNERSLSDGMGQTYLKPSNVPVIDAPGCSYWRATAFM